MAYVDELSAQANLPRQPDNSLLEGYVVPGSWDPAEGTIEVLLGDTAGIFTDYGDSPTTILANLMTPGLGAQYGPVGGERVELFRTPSGYSAQLEHGPDDTPGAPTGEWWILHRNAVGVYDSGWKLTNDAVLPGDGLGGAFFGNLGAFTQLRTRSGELTVSLDETTQTITINAYGNTIVLTADPSITMTTPAGLVHSMDDASGLIGIGAKGSALASTDAAAAEQHLAGLGSNIVSGTLQTLITELMGVFVAQSVPNAPLVEAIVTATDWVKNIPDILPTIPTCSAVTRIASIHP